MSYLLQFGLYQLPSGLLPSEESGAQDGAEQSLPRRPGAVSQAVPRTEPRSLSIAGSFGADTLSAWEAIKSGILDNCVGSKANLYYGRDDRYYRNAYLTSYGFSDPAEGRLYGAIGTCTLQFTASDYPEAFGTASHTPPIGTGGGTINYSQGTAPTLPVWTITIGATGTGPLTLNNATTGESCILNLPGGFTAADVLVLSRDGSTATKNGVAVVGLFDRRIPRLVPGNNTITLTTGGTATVSTLAVSYPARFR